MKTKRWIAALLCFLLIGSLFPANAFAAGGVIGGKYTLTLDENWEGGMGQVIPNITSYELPSATTRPGENFYGWATVPDGTVRYLAGDTVTLTDNLTLYAVWTFTQTFSISVQPVVGGSAFCDKSFAAAGETVTLTAIPDANYALNGWFVSAPNGLIIRDNKFIMPDSDVTVKALFFDSLSVESPYRVHIRPEEGSGTVFTITNETTLTWQQYQAGTYDETKGTFFKNESGELFYEFPKQCPFTAPEGKVFDCWQASTTEDNLGSYSGGYIVGESVFPSVTGGRTITLTALWKDAEQSAAYSITVESSNGGTATADNVSAAEGKTITLTATPNNGYHFKEWQSSDVTINENSFTMPEKNVTVKAIFEADAPTTYTGTGWNLDADGVLHITGDIPESGFNLTDEQKQQVKSAVAASGASISSGKFLFNGFENMTSADLRLLNTTGVTDMSYMFYRCSSLTSLNLSNFDTISVTTMDGMFSGCSSLTSLDVSGFSTSNVTSMIGMFTNCSSLTSLYLSSFDTGSMTSMAFMFSGCSSLTSIDLSKFETGNVTSMAAMFINCSSLTSLDLSSFDTRRVNNMGGMFCNCSGLTSLDLSSFDTSSVNNMSNVFEGCSSLTSLDVSGFKTDSLMYASEMFLGCSALTSLGIRPDILYINADGIIAIRSSWQKQGSTVSFSTANDLKAVTDDTVTLLAMYTVNVQNDGNGTASANPAAAVKGDTVTLTATPNTGYHFKEWQSSDVTVSNNTFTMPKKDVTVKAIFESDAPTTYTVSFNMNGHGTQVADQTVADGNKAIKPADPTASGWTFGGWYADATFSAKFDFNTAITANTTIYAKWTENTTPPAPTYTMIAGMGGEWTEGSMSGLSFTSDAPFAKFDSVQVDGSTIAATNYTAKEGSTKITLAPAYLETLSVGSHSIRIVSKDGSASTNFTVKAAAQPPVPAKYTVSFNMNGHGMQITAQTVESGSKAAKPVDPKASGYTFGGWYADATFSTKFDFNTAITANTTVYAKWTKNSAAPADPTSPQTGDTSDMFLWIALLLVSGGALVGTTVYSRKKKCNAK